MKLAIFGGTGFIGYDFVRACLEAPNIEFTIYSSSPKSLVNVLRHDVDIQLYSPKSLQSIELPEGTDFIINFSHPFSVRDDSSPKHQMNGFIKFVENQKNRIPALRLIHISTMSVYEPFSKSEYYSEGAVVSPPKSDSYATEKVYIESKLLSLKDAEKWQLHLRPTVVYGPFCRPWTDRIFEWLQQGELACLDLSGKIQPIYVRDVTKFLMRSLNDYVPGIFNLAGAEVITWKEFINIFVDIVPGSKLVYDPRALPSEQGPSVGVLSFILQNLKILLKLVVTDPAFDRMVAPFARRLPRSFVIWVRDRLFFGGVNSTSGDPVISFLASSFYSENRLVSMEKFFSYFNEFNFIAIEDVKDRLEKYYRYRFSDEVLN